MLADDLDHWLARTYHRAGADQDFADNTINHRSKVAVVIERDQLLQGAVGLSEAVAMVAICASRARLSARNASASCLPLNAWSVAAVWVKIGRYPFFWIVSSCARPLAATRSRVSAETNTASTISRRAFTSARREARAAKSEVSLARVSLMYCDEIWLTISPRFTSCPSLTGTSVTVATTSAATTAGSPMTRPSPRM